MKKFVLLLCILMFSVPSMVQAASSSNTPFTVYVDGQMVKFTNIPITEQGTTLVPFRNLFEAMGAYITYDSKTQTVKASKGSTTVQLIIGQNLAFKDGQAIKLNVAPKQISGVTYVPLRFVSQSFDYILNLQGKQIYITSPPVLPITPTPSPKPTPTPTPSPTPDATLTVEQVGELSNRVVYIELMDSTSKVVASGSGVIVGSNGEILTNHHVIEGAASAKVYLSDKRSFTTTTLLLDDKKRDLALLKIDATALPSITLGNSSSLTLGQTVVAIGSPLGFTNTLTSGVVSSPLRTVDGSDYIQISAPIDHGSSGGALFNMKGELVGITTALVVSSANINLAIPSNDVKIFLANTRTAMTLVAAPGNTSPPANSAYTSQQLQDYLNTNFGNLTFKNVNLTFQWAVIESSDNEDYLIAGTMYDSKQWVDLTSYQINDSTVYPSLLYFLSDKLKTNLNISNTFFSLYLNTHLSSYSKSFPPGSLTPEAGGYRLNYNFIYGSMDYDSGYMYYNLDPTDSNGIQRMKI